MFCPLVVEEIQLSVGEVIERANRNIIRNSGELKLTQGDIIVNDRNADPCTSYDCMWNKSGDGHYYVPYAIANHYSDRELEVIQRALDSFSGFSCIRFYPVLDSGRPDFIHIQSLDGCYSNIGRLGYEQTLSLDRNGCIYHNTVQHELLHALGFHHEHVRSDRDDYIQVGWENIMDGYQQNFDKVDTLNQGTSYDYGSVMQYHKTAFSKNGLPTMIPIPDPNAPIGYATEMSQNDIFRLNSVYKCHV